MTSISIRYILILLLGISSFPGFSQSKYTFADTLRGSLRPERTCYDVTYYELDINLDIPSKSISGINDMYFKATQPFSRIQVDLFENMLMDSIIYNGKSLAFERLHQAVFIQFPKEVPANTTGKIRMYYHGQPNIARNPPWDGGFTWTKDKQNRPWIAVSCEHHGASSWWPNKDHLSDEPDSMKIFVEVPDSLFCKSNGRLITDKKVGEGRRRFGWRVVNPINNYNVTLNIGHYVFFKDTYVSEVGDELELEYYVLDYNLEKAKAQFEQVKPMLACYENWFGKYPFWQDAFSLVETPYLGMEHQSAIAYGNKYQNGYLGMDRSGTGVGLKFDYIIIHESGHEYWGNHVSCQDHADMWIHESFTTYAEALYIECLFGRKEADNYLLGMRKNIANRRPIIPDFGVNAEPPGDMYDKGALMLYTLRNIIDDDALWKEILREIQREFGMKTTNTAEIVDYISARAEKQGVRAALQHYLYQPQPPTLAYQIKKEKKGTMFQYKWQAETDDFDMPIEIVIDKKRERIFPTINWQEMPLKDPKNLTIDKDRFYIKVQEYSDMDVLIGNQ